MLPSNQKLFRNLLRAGSQGKADSFAEVIFKNDDMYLIPTVVICMRVYCLVMRRMYPNTPHLAVPAMSPCPLLTSSHPVGPHSTRSRCGGGVSFVAGSTPPLVVVVGLVPRTAGISGPCRMLP